MSVKNLGRLAAGATFLVALTPGAVSGAPHTEPRLSLVAPSHYVSGRPIVFSGSLGMAGLGIPGQVVRILSDGSVVAHTRTTLDGTYTLRTTFNDFDANHLIRATSSIGPRETASSPVVTITRERRLVDLQVSSDGTLVGTGQTTAFHALGRFDDGLESDVTEDATWLSSNDGVATVSNDLGSRGVVTGTGSGIATVTASLGSETAGVPITCDATPPSLVDFSFSPASVDTSASDQTITFSMHVADDLAGFANGAINFQIDIFDPLGRDAGSTYPLFASGSNTDAVFTGDYTLPRYSAQGTYQVAVVRFTDTAGNGQELSAADLAAMGFPTTFTNG
jgi:hypothetical protein